MLGQRPECTDFVEPAGLAVQPYGGGERHSIPVLRNWNGIRDNAEVDVRVAESAVDVAVVRQLWREYWDSVGLPKNFQGFDAELAGLPGIYGAEGGVLLLASQKEEPAGTIALRRLNGTSGEVKRLYLRPKFRGHGLGRRLLNEVIQRAGGFQYDCLYADTLPNMMEALSLYERVGFERVEAYSNTPTPNAIYLRLKL